MIKYLNFNFVTDFYVENQSKHDAGAEQFESTEKIEFQLLFSCQKQLFPNYLYQELNWQISYTVR